MRIVNLLINIFSWKLKARFHYILAVEMLENWRYAGSLRERELRAIEKSQFSLFVYLFQFDQIRFSPIFIYRPWWGRKRKKIKKLSAGVSERNFVRFFRFSRYQCSNIWIQLPLDIWGGKLLSMNWNNLCATDQRAETEIRQIVKHCRTLKKTSWICRDTLLLMSIESENMSDTFYLFIIVLYVINTESCSQF